MKAQKTTRSWPALVLALLLSFVLVACGANSGSTGSSTDSTQSDADTGATSTATTELTGKPWTMSILIGNLPTEQPEAKDDLYTHYDYDYLVSHQDKDSSAINDYANELQTSVTAIIKDESQTSHDLNQLRIFYNQAADIEALQAAGLSEIQPYLDRVDAVTSIEQLNELLVAEDFPFSPFITATLSANDTRTTNIVAINPNFMLSDALLVGGMFYQESDDPQVQQNLDDLIWSSASIPMVDLMCMGMTQDEVQDAMTSLIDFEKSYGKYLEAPDTYLKADYGVMAQDTLDSYYTLDELCALAPNFPLKETLVKLKKENSQTYVATQKWIEAFSDLWTEENLDTIKLITKVKILEETRPYRDPSLLHSMMEQSDMDVPDAESFAYEACTELDTLANVVAKTYVDDVLGPNAKARLSKLSQDLVDTYKVLVDHTTWMGEESQQRIIEKLDHMTLNILEPVGGYLDYSKLELTPTEKGGTLFSNYLTLKQYRLDRESELIGQPVVAATPWFIVTPTMSNAFYDPTSNSINIFPGFITSLIYNDDMSDTDLLAAAGWTIGHEISHGFDYAGSQLDAYGTPTPVFADADVDAFVLKSSALALYYNTIEIQPGQMVDGQAVVGEATADLSGMQACLELAKQVDGFDYAKYFAGISHMWAEVMSEAMMQQQTLDTHPLSNLRINVSSQMFDELYDQYGVTEGDGMYLPPTERMVMWGENA